MKRIISIRLKSEDPTKREQFIRGSAGTIQSKIVNLINRDQRGNYDFLIEEDGKKYIQDTNQLLGELVNIIDDKYLAEFEKDKSGTIISVCMSADESLMNQHTLDQLKMVRKLSKGTDIGDKIGNMEKQGGNIQFMRNPIDSGIETYQDFERSNNKFEPSWNIKRMKPFKTYFYDQTTSGKKSHKKSKGKK